MAPMTVSPSLTGDAKIIKYLIHNKLWIKFYPALQLCLTEIFFGVCDGTKGAWILDIFGTHIEKHQSYYRP